MVNKEHTKKRKEVKKSISNLDFYFTILELLEKGLNPTDISKRLNMSKQAIFYYIRLLKANGNIKKIGYGVWKVTSKEVKKSTMYGRNIRAHSYRFKLIPKNNIYYQAKITLNKTKTNYKFIGINKKTISFKFKTHTIWICQNGTIDIIFRRGQSFFSSSAKSGYDKAFQTALNLVLSLQNKLKVNISYWKGNFKLKANKQHYSLIKNELAQEMRGRGINYTEIRDNNNILWCLVDNSFNLDELEAVNNKTAIKDTDKVLTPFMNALRENPNILEELTQNIVLNTKMLRAMQDEIVILTKLYRKE